MKFISLGDRDVRTGTVFAVRRTYVFTQFDSDGTPCVMVDYMHSAGYCSIELVCVSDEERDALAGAILAELEASND